MIELINISKEYRDGDRVVNILDNFSLRIEDGELVVIVGPSGCGKTTLLNIIGGLLTPTSGQVLINGQDYYAMDKPMQADFRADNVGYVFQDFYLIDDFSLVNNVLLSMQQSTLSKRGRQRVAIDLLSELGLGDRIEWNIKNLSGGERQRVAIARALANDHEIILCDEPTGRLDEETANEIIGVLHDLKKQGRTVIVVTHNTRYTELADQLIDFSVKA